jgi:DNA polymerase V
VTIAVCYDSSTLEIDGFDGELCSDYYGRLAPKPAHASASFSTETNSSAQIVAAIVGLYEQIVNRDWFVRRMYVNANNVIPQSQRQPTLFDQDNSSAKEDSLQETRLAIIKKFGKNALLKGTDYEEGATTRDRNAQIGGHKA